MKIENQNIQIVSKSSDQTARSLTNLTEQAGSVAAVSFGRLNPITTGHEKMVNALKKQSKIHKATPMLYLSHSQDKKKNPLSYNEKVSLAKKAFGSIVKVSKSRTIFEIFKELNKKFKEVVLVVGSDRVNEFRTLMNKYNNNLYKFDKITVISAGERDPDSDSVSGMSASKMRDAVQKGDKSKFKQGLPKKLQARSKQIFDLVRDGMGLKEIKEDLMKELKEEGLLALDEVLTLQQRMKKRQIFKRYKAKIQRARKIAMRRFAKMPNLKKRAQLAARKLIRKRVAGERGTNYQKLSASEKIQIDKMLEKKKGLIRKLAIKLLPRVKRAETQRLASFRKGAALKSHHEENIKSFKEMISEKPEVPQDRDVKDRPGSQPKGYYKGLSKGQKERRASQFEKQTDKPASMAKPAPGDLDKSGKFKKTKLSKHTKKYRQMYGEEVNDKELITIIEKVMDRIETTQLDEKSLEGLKKKSEKSGIPYSILKQVYNRGLAAWRTGHRPGANPQQWGYARVNSFITKGKGTWGGADKDLAAKVRKESVEMNEGFQMAYDYFGKPAVAPIADKFKELKINGGFHHHPDTIKEMEDNEKDVKKKKITITIDEGVEELNEMKSFKQHMKKPEEVKPKKRENDLQGDEVRKEKADAISGNLYKAQARDIGTDAA